MAVTGSATYRKVDPDAVITIHVKVAAAPWLYVWGRNAAGASVEPNGSWPGTRLSATTEVDGQTFYYCIVDGLETAGCIINNGSNQTVDVTEVVHNGLYRGVPSGGDKAQVEFLGDFFEYSGVDGVATGDDTLPCEYYNLQGLRVDRPDGGIYIVRQGSSARRVYIP